MSLLKDSDANVRIKSAQALSLVYLSAEQSRESTEQGLESTEQPNGSGDKTFEESTSPFIN